MTLVHEIDYGTPASNSDKTVTLTVDGIEITVPEGVWRVPGNQQSRN